eukprot:SAG31_NODE_1308_length_8879_cov_3.158884_2_plen_258_part_00
MRNSRPLRNGYEPVDTQKLNSNLIHCDGDQAEKLAAKKLKIGAKKLAKHLASATEHEQNVKEIQKKYASEKKEADDEINNLKAELQAKLQEAEATHRARLETSLAETVAAVEMDLVVAQQDCVALRQAAADAARSQEARVTAVTAELELAKQAAAVQKTEHAVQLEALASDTLREKALATSMLAQFEKQHDCVESLEQQLKSAQERNCILEMKLAVERKQHIQALDTVRFEFVFPFLRYSSAQSSTLLTFSQPCIVL